MGYGQYSGRTAPRAQGRGTRAANNQELAHWWANQTKPEGRGSNFYFDGPDLYSYGRHFLVARIIQPPKGRKHRIVLFNDRSYSNSTSRHQSYARMAVWRDDIRLTVSDMGGNAEAHKANRARYIAARDAAIDTAARSRKYAESHLERAAEHVAEANRYAEAFRLSWRLVMPKMSAEDLAERIKAQRIKAAADAKRDAKKRAEAEASARRKFAQMVAEWRAGVLPAFHYNRDAGIMLRVIDDGATVETSLGARVPADDARELYALVVHVQKSGEGVQFGRGSRNIGDYPVDRIEADGTLHAGCHTIAYAELAACAALLGVANV